jgi:hypothetical protein
MAVLMSNSPDSTCPGGRAASPTLELNQSGDTFAAPDWAEHCVDSPGRRSFGYVGQLSKFSSETLGVGSWWSIMGPAFLIFPVMVINSVVGRCRLTLSNPR